MAGVGFELKKLFRARSVSGQLKAYSYAAMITTGPFLLLTGMVLAVQLLFRLQQVPPEQNRLFVASTVYAFIFSQLLASGFLKVVTRYLADCLSQDRYRDITASCFGLSALLLALGSLLAGLFFLGSPLSLGEKLSAYLFFALLLVIWSEGIYLTALRKYRPLLLVFAAGVCLGVLAVALLLQQRTLTPAVAALLGIDGALSVMACLFLLQIIRFFGLPRGGRHFAFLPYLEREWRLFAYAFLISAGTFLPNFLIWVAGAWGETVAGTYRYAPLYDVVTFYAFLSILPLTILFVVSMETRFQETYARYFRAITHKGNFRDIQATRTSMVHTLWFELRSALEFQLLFTLLFLACGTYVLSWANIGIKAVDMYAVLLMAVYFVGVLQVLLVLLEYFDAQHQLLRIAGMFFLSSGLFCGLGVFCAGSLSYGFTFFLAAALTLAYAWRQLAGYVQRINYYVFCGQPVFYHRYNGWLTRLTRRLYGQEGDCLGKEAET